MKDEKDKKKNKPGAVKTVKVKGIGEKILKTIKKVNKNYAVIVGLVLMAVMLPITAYLISRNQQNVVEEAATLNRPVFNSISPSTGRGDQQNFVTVVSDPNGAGDIKMIGLWFDNQPPKSSRTHMTFHATVRKESGVWRYYGHKYLGPKYTCEDGSTGSACWMNYNISIGGYTPSDNTKNKIYTGGSYSDGTVNFSSRISAWKVRSVRSSGDRVTVVWDVTFKSNYPVRNVDMYVHAEDQAGNWNDPDDYWKDRGNWDTREEPNSAPVISSRPSTSVKVGQHYRYEIIARDADGDPLSYKTSTKPGWLSLSGNVLSGTPSDAYVGSNSVVVVVTDGKVNTTQAFSISVYRPAPTPQPIPQPTLPPEEEDENQPPSVTVKKPDKNSVFRAGGNIIKWSLNDEDGISSISLYYSVDGENWLVIQEGVAGTKRQYTWDVSPIISGNYYLKVVAVDNSEDKLSGSGTSEEFAIDNNPRGDNKPVIRGLNPGDNDVIEDTTPTISAAYDSGNIKIDLNSVELKLDSEVVAATVLATSCNYVPEEPLGVGVHNVELSIRNTKGEAASRVWSFTVFGEISPESSTLEQKEVMTLPIIGEVSKGVGIALIVCFIVVLLIVGVFAAIKLIGALRRGEDEEMELPQYYADYAAEEGEPSGEQAGEPQVPEFSEDVSTEEAPESVPEQPIVTEPTSPTTLAQGIEPAPEQSQQQDPFSKDFDQPTPDQTPPVQTSPQEGGTPTDSSDIGFGSSGEGPAV